MISTIIYAILGLATLAVVVAGLASMAQEAAVPAEPVAPAAVAKVETPPASADLINQVAGIEAKVDVNTRQLQLIYLKLTELQQALNVASIQRNPPSLQNQAWWSLGDKWVPFKTWQVAHHGGGGMVTLDAGAASAGSLLSDEAFLNIHNTPDYLRVMTALRGGTTLVNYPEGLPYSGGELKAAGASE